MLPMPPAFVPWALGIVSGVAGMVAMAVARWHIGGLRREQLVRTIADAKLVYEEQDRELVRLREAVKTALARNNEINERLRAESEQCMWLLRRHYRWTRYVARLHNQMREAGIDIPALPAEDEES